MKILFALCIALLGFTPAHARKQKKATERPAASAPAQDNSSVQKGLFNVLHQGEDWFFEIPDTLFGRELLATVRYTGASAGSSQYGGDLLKEQTVYWQRANDGKILLRSRLLINVADTIDAINRAVTASNVDPIIASFKPETTASKGSVRIKVSSFLLEDNPALTPGTNVRRRLGLASPLAASSYVESVKTFPQNTEVRTIRTWAAAQGGQGSPAAILTGKVTLGLNLSFVLLPEVPMMPRLFDPRVGYFTDSYYYYSDDQQTVTTKRFITRWRLEPRDSADAARQRSGELIEPKKPIVYYIDPATPKQWRPYLIQGVEDWQKAFEKAGWKNAICAKEWPAADSTMSLEDARYSVIRYLASPIENAMGPHIHDPRSGEIMESHICWYHNVMKLLHDWYMIQAGTLDEAAQCMKYDPELMGQLIRFVSSHEVGHTLGLRHNFGSSSTVPVDSLRSKRFVEANGHTPSIMDYARFNYVAQPEDSISRTGIFPRIGDYDVWAIEWGYTPMPEAYDAESDHWEIEKLTSRRLEEGGRRLWFGDGETNATNDPRCQTEDLGDDAVKASEYGIKNLKRELAELPQWTYQSNDIYNRNLIGMYGQIQTQYLRYCLHVMKNLGGVMADYGTVDEGGMRYTDTPKKKQQEALDFIDRNVLHEPSWLDEPAYVKSFVPDTERLNTRLGAYLVNQLLSYELLGRLTSTWPVEQYLPEVCKRIFRRVGAQATPYETELQVQAVTTLTDVFRSASSTSKVRGVVLVQLRALEKQLKAVTNNPQAASMADVIARTLVIK